jgi:hypothetical protein
LDWMVRKRLLTVTPYIYWAMCKSRRSDSRGRSNFIKKKRVYSPSYLLRSMTLMHLSLPFVERLKLFFKGW